MSRSLTTKDIQVGADAPLLIIAGPCVIESEEQSLLIASTLQSICDNAGVGYMFKGSFDKANRTSLSGKRGLGLEETLHDFAEMKKDTERF